LQKLGGNGTGDAASGSPNSTGDGQNQDLYPTIRQLPLLGVRWADLYRRTRVQEAVFEVLTKQYELAKVEEARETPSVKVLDLADVPERKSYPPRLVLMILGAGFVFVVACIWVLARRRWLEIDPMDPGKVLAQQIFQSVQMNGRRIASVVSRKSRDGEGSFPNGS